MSVLNAIMERMSRRYFTPKHARRTNRAGKRYFSKLVATGNDTEIKALTVDKTTSPSRTDPNGTRRFLTLDGTLVTEADVDRAYARWGNNPTARVSARQYVLAKQTARTMPTATDPAAAEFVEQYHRER
jgi:hypothetical protein